METEAGAPAAKKRRAEAPERKETGEVSTSSPRELIPLSSSPPPPTDAPTSGLGVSPGQEPPAGAGGEEAEGIDRIGSLPDALLGDIVSLLPTKDGARTQTLASRWRRLWRSAPLNLDCSGGDLPADEEALAGLMSQILAAHQGPARRLSVPVLLLHNQPATVDGWLRSPTLDNLQELEFDIGQLLYGRRPDVSLPPSAFRFSATLQVLTISNCHLPDGVVDALPFPLLRQLGLETVEISEGSLHSVIAGCPVLECLLLCRSYGFRSLRINSPSLVSIGLRARYGELVNFVIEDAPSLERLLQLELHIAKHVLVISAPKLETLGCLYDRDLHLKFTFGTTVLQGLHTVSFMEEVRSIKILAINIYQLSLDTVINLLRCFPCVEKLYIQTSRASGGQNLWRRKHRDLVKCLDIRLKAIVLKNYRGIKSQVNFATFFVLNAKILEAMRFEGGAYNDRSRFIAQQRRLLQVEKRASRGAQFYFTSSSCCHNLPDVKHVHDLSKTDPFLCRRC